MSAEAIVVAGTDTGVGKTVFAAALTRALDGCYWKPVQAGREPGDPLGATDTARARALSGLPADRFLPEAYSLAEPLSPHRAAELDGVELREEKLALPRCGRTLIVELAGGLLVPLRRGLLQIDVVRAWGAPVVLCARTALGTINHTLLSLEALRRRGVPTLGVAFIGEPQPHAEQAIVSFGGAARLGRLPRLGTLEPGALAEAFAREFRRERFLGVAA